MSEKHIVPLMEFVKKWNEDSRGITFTLVQGSGANRPSSIEIRFSPSRYLGLYFSDQFSELTEEINLRSHQTMLVSTSEELFLRGILDIKIASENHSYSDILIKRILQWIGEEAFT